MIELVKNNDSETQVEINDINQKLDFIIEELAVQKQKRQAVEDLLSDLNLIGNDMFKSAVDELDHAGTEVDVEELKSFAFRLLRSTGRLNETLQMLESTIDLMKEAGPIITQMGLDGIQKMAELESKGYFAFLREMGRVLDNVVTHFSAEDVKLLADNIVTIMETVKNLTQPEMLKAMNNAINVYKNLDMDDIEEYSLWKAFREIRSPEMKRGVGFVMTFLKKISDDNNLKTTNNKN